MKQLQDLIKDIFENGINQLNTRTGHICRAVVGRQLTFDISQNFPATTGKKLAFNAMKGELLGFFRGYTNAADFRALGCGIWDQNANETKAWLENFYRKGTDDLGDIYGKQWVDWQAYRISKSKEEDEYLEKNGWKQRLSGVMPKDGKLETLFEKRINQLENALRTIITNPSDRRIIMTGWNVGEFDKMALPPCHCTYTFVPFEDTKTLHVVMSIR